MATGRRPFFCGNWKLNAPAQARPHAIGEKARAKTRATGAAAPSRTSMKRMARPEASAGSRRVGRFEALAIR
jgi:hypothetical protein